MRVISGKYRGMVLAEFKGMDIRPTADRVKESVFQILTPCFQGARVLDLFAGSGALGIESLSRGAAEAVFNDSSKESLKVCRANLQKVGESAAVYNLDYKSCLRSISGKFRLIFCDPPTFLNSSRMGKRTWDVQRDHVELLKGVVGLLEQGGVAIFSCNLRSFKPDVEAFRAAGIGLEDITERTIPEDFQRNKRIHHCYLVRRL